MDGSGILLNEVKTMSIMEMEEIKSAIAGVESKVEYNGGA